MRRWTQMCRFGTAAAVAALVAATAANVALAGSKVKSVQPTSDAAYDIGSLASPFLQSKTQITILVQDDQAAPACQSKHFVKASPAEAPAVNSIGSITERKWREMWTLDRCGSKVNYWVYFTEVGNGGAYYAIVPGPQEDGTAANVAVRP